MGTVTDSLDALEEPDRSTLGRIIAIARELAPDAVEGTGYGLAALRYREQGYAAAVRTAGHLALYPFSGAVLPALADEGALDGFDHDRGTLRFSAEHPPPDDLVREIFTRRKAEIDARAAKRR